jgi:hypothetical protein
MKRSFILVVLLGASLLIGGWKGNLKGETKPTFQNQIKEKDDEVTLLLKKALKLYQRGRFGEAIGELHFAISQIRSRQVEEYKKLLPPPPESWKADEPTNTMVAPSLLGGGIKVSRRYHGPSQEEVEVTIISQSPIISSLLSLFSNFSLLGGTDNTRFFLYKGEKALEHFDPQGGKGEIYVIVGGKGLVIVKGTGLPKASSLKVFLSALNWKKVEAFIDQG